MKNTILLDKFKMFVKDLPSEIPSVLTLDKEVLPELFHAFEYPISSWPVLLNKDLTKKINEISTAIPSLLAQIPKLYFENDVKKIADFYFNGDEMSAHFAMMCLKKNMEVSSRLDLSLTKEGFKVLEVNMGSSIGGMEIQNFEPLIRRLHLPLSESDKENNFISKPTQSIYIEFIVDKILQHISSDLNVVNVFLATGLEKDNPVRATVDEFFHGLLNQELEKRSKKGSVFSGNVKELKLENEQLNFNTEPVHAVLAFDFLVSEVSMDLFRALAMNKVYYPDHMGTTLLRDKRNLAILYQLATENRFDESSNQLILECIPWTTNLEDKEVKFKDENIGIIDLLLQNKNQFVIKISDGLQGDDVFIGKEFDIAAWEKVIYTSLHRKKFIVQEYCESIDLLAPDDSNNWLPHKLVWGAFGFGEKYAGVWVRMNVRGKGKEVINSATGAKEAIVYESY